MTGQTLAGPAQTGLPFQKALNCSRLSIGGVWVRVQGLTSHLLALQHRHRQHSPPPTSSVAVGSPDTLSDVCESSQPGQCRV